MGIVFVSQGWPPYLPLPFPHLLLHLLRQANGREQLEDGGEGEGDNPLIAVQKEHQRSGGHQEQRADNLLQAQAANHRAGAPDGAEHLRRRHEQRTYYKYIRRQGPTGDVGQRAAKGHHRPHGEECGYQGLFHSSMSSSNT